MGLTIASALLVACLAAIFRSEFDAWMPWLAERLRRVALRSVDEGIKERLDEEWAAFLIETPGNIGKILAGFGFILASKKLRLYEAYRRFFVRITFGSAQLGINLISSVEKKLRIVTNTGDRQHIEKMATYCYILGIIAHHASRYTVFATELTISMLSDPDNQKTAQLHWSKAKPAIQEASDKVGKQARAIRKTLG